MKQIKLIATSVIAVFFFTPAFATTGEQNSGPVSDQNGAAWAPASPTISEPDTGQGNPGKITLIDGFDGSEPTIPGDIRIFRDGLASTCAPAKPFPGIFPSSGSVLYDAHTFFNNGPEKCVTVNFDTGSCGAAAHVTAYAGAFNPNTIGANYLGDVGDSVTQPFSFIAPANSPITIVVTTNFGPTVCDYEIDSDELDNARARAVPFLSPLALLATIIGLLWLGGRRR